jgi:spore coat protein A
MQRAGAHHHRAFPGSPRRRNRVTTLVSRAFTTRATRIIVRFEGYAGRYVWHCHVLEHAANEMMRPFEVVARRRQARAG